MPGQERCKAVRVLGEITDRIQTVAQT
jgi:hypothetical protein